VVLGRGGCPSRPACREQLLPRASVCRKEVVGSFCKEVPLELTPNTCAHGP